MNKTENAYSFILHLAGSSFIHQPDFPTPRNISMYFLFFNIFYFQANKHV